MDNAAQKYFSSVRGDVCGGELIFGCRFVYLVTCSPDCINLCKHCLGVSVEKWKFREVTTVNLRIFIIFVMYFLGSASQSALIASDERCYKSGKCIRKVLFYFKDFFFFCLNVDYQTWKTSSKCSHLTI